MSRRRRLLRTTLILCSLPVLAVSIFVVVQQTSKDAPYVAGEETEGITRALDRAVDAGSAPIRFTEVTEPSGVDFVHFPFRRTSQLPEDMGSGAAWADYDGDGWTDLFLVNIAAPVGVPDEEMAASAATDRLYRNRGDGTFEDVTKAAGVGAAHRGQGAAWGDYDADGDPDLFVTSWGENLLWENRGDGTFVDATTRAGLGGEGFWTAAAWSDFDLDGDLDLYVGGYVEYVPEDPAQIAKRSVGTDFPFTLNPSSWPAHANRFWVNRGDGTFEERSEPAGIRGETGKTLCAAWSDFDADGLPDLYVANDVSDNAMYRNRGDGTFEDVSYAALVADYRGAMGIAVGDWDGDLDLDLFVTHWIAQENALYTNVSADLEDTESRGSMMFIDDADRVGLGQIALDLIGWGTAFVDLDSDGRLDLFVANGSTFQDRTDPSRLVPMDAHLYWNRGPEEGFFEIGEEAGIRTDPPGVGRGAAFCDWDADGDLDLVVCRHGERVRLLRNDSEGGHRVTFRLEARSGHPSGLGARIVVHAGGRAFLREAGSGPSYLSQNAPEVLVGLGESAHVDSVEIRWPRGAREVWTDLAVDRAWILEEGSPPRAVAVRSPAAPLTREQIRRFWALKREADELMLASDWRKAEAALQELITLDPRHEDSLYGRGNCLLELGRYAEASRSWEELLRVNPASSRAWVQIGLVHSLPEARELFDLKLAAEAFGRAHDINPEESGPLILQGEALLASGDHAAAEDVLSSAFQMNDRATSAFYLCAWLAWNRGDEARATELLRRAQASLEGMTPVRGVLGEGDTKSPALEAARRVAASRRLFAECIELLRESPGPVDPREAFAWLDESLAGLP